MKVVVVISLWILVSRRLAADAAVTPGFCVGENAGPTCSQIDATEIDCERVEGCTLGNNTCSGDGDGYIGCSTLGFDQCETLAPPGSVCLCDTCVNDWSWCYRFCDTLTSSDNCEPIIDPFCEWIHTCPAEPVTEEEETSDPCGDCLDLCRETNSPNCCWGVGCFCESGCSGGLGPITTIVYKCPPGMTRRGNFPDYGCCPSACTKTIGNDFSFDDMECYCDNPVCADNGGAADNSNNGSAGNNSGKSSAQHYPLWVTIVAASLLLLG